MIWSNEVVRCDGNLFAYVRVQDEYTGNIAGSFRRIYFNKEGKAYYKADGKNQLIDVNPFLQYEERVKKALEFQKKYEGKVF